MKSPRILIVDIETAPILAYCWGLWDQTVGLNQIHTDWYVLAWSAKWLDESKVMYRDQRGVKDKENDSGILKELWKLMDDADIIVTQNGKQFDAKKLNARFVINGFKPPSPYKHIDTRQLAKKHFGFTSNKLEYMTSKLNVKYKKLKHNKYAGFDLWKECLADNLDAWKEMEKYNKYDVLSTEELYKKLIPWGNPVNFSPYGHTKCTCGSGNIEKRGYSYTSMGKYQRFVCRDCGTWTKDGENVLPKGINRTFKRSA